VEEVEVMLVVVEHLQVDQVEEEQADQDQVVLVQQVQLIQEVEVEEQELLVLQELVNLVEEPADRESLLFQNHQEHSHQESGH
jgi:hypothetical protein